ncbi:hypothetical protein [uncultured Vibrio sp.]|uniref:hypothetical protein n=1 Tax=uncultured Vibrio sp. TaxID=114054 RepID=UPI0009203274|nr:hypothetical protein [uncultured Vibrio sp.]OIQ26667.1 MAG: hypothetical protein BM561_02675 [Vibrio sp. MedPE-SWchi]
MKRIVIAALLTLSSSSAFSADAQCLNKKYDAYIDASLTWYQDLASLTSERYPNLSEVSEWFLEGRKNHFELNRAAVHYYLENDPSKLATEQSVEAWLQLEQLDVKALAERDDELGQAAKLTFSDRQSTPHEKNYELRSAFADLLSHPKQIDSVLQKYNQSILALEEMNCK